MSSMYNLAFQQIAKGTSRRRVAQRVSSLTHQGRNITPIDWYSIISSSQNQSANANVRLLSVPVSNSNTLPAHTTPRSHVTSKNPFPTTTIKTSSLHTSNVGETYQTRKTPRRRRKSNPPVIETSMTSHATKEEASLLPTLNEEEYDPMHVIDQIRKASSWNQGRAPGESDSSLPNRKFVDRKWDYEFVRSAVDLYERHLLYIQNHLQFKGPRDNSKKVPDASVLFADIHPSPAKCKATDMLVAPSSLASAVRALTRSRLDTPILSKRIRNMERLIGAIGWTPISEGLSYRLLEANGKAGNVRRSLALLELRRRRGYDPKVKEFIHIITSIKAAQLPLRRSRNIYLHETALSESSLENPTRYLDAVLVNMSQRGVPLTPDMAALLLSCYSSTGRSGRALHYFYKVVHDPIEDDGMYIPGPHPTHLGKEGLEEWKNRKRGEGMGRLLVPRDIQNNNETKNSAYEELEAMKADDDEMILKTRVRMNMHPSPPFHKIPSAVKGASLSQGRNQEENEQTPTLKFAKPMTKLEWELERDWSLSLTAAFAFADSLTHGACGHEPIELNIAAWNALIKACCYRGAFHRALKILDETLPQKGIDPDRFSYNTILSGLARVGDIATLRELLVKMTNRSIPVDKYTAQAMADGLLNIGDISGASTIVQDIFNQHDRLPPYQTHLKIIEFALANNLIFEAKRHVYFVQQLWKWEPSKHHSKEFCAIMEATKRNPKLSKDALQKLFRYFGEELHDKDFF